MSSTETIEQKLKGDIDQHWRENGDHTIFRDQYGNEIHKLRDTYILYRKQEKIVEVNRFHTAKLISAILVNDIIHYKDISKK
jgi:hypothetical protein